jgi:2'-5' RNA ligase
MRLFVAVAVPADIKRSLAETQRELQKLLPQASIRWTPEEQVHLTLRFFGSVSCEQLDALQNALNGSCGKALPLNLQGRGLGVFPAKREPRIIWAGVHDSTPRLQTLYSGIQNVTEQFGQKPDARNFSAHLTLGRIKEIRSSEARGLREFIHTRISRAFGSWEVGAIELRQSFLGPTGAKHSVVSLHSLQS